MTDFTLIPSDILSSLYERKLMGLKKRGYKLFQLLVLTVPFAFIKTLRDI